MPEPVTGTLIIPYEARSWGMGPVHYKSAEVYLDKNDPRIKLSYANHRNQLEYEIKVHLSAADGGKRKSRKSKRNNRRTNRKSRRS